MNSVPLHPLFVHVPLALAVIVPVVAGGLLLAWWRGWLPARTWLVVVGLQTALVAGGFAAMRTGEGEEEPVEAIVAEAAIESHEEAAEVFVWTAVVALVLALAGAFVPREGLRRAAAGATLAVMIAVAVLGVRTGSAGGDLVYRHGAAAAYAAPPAGGGTEAATAAPDERRRGRHGRAHGDRDDD